MNPSDFTVFPSSSVLQKSEAETIALNVIVILKRTGDTWRELGFDEYKTERIKDGNFSEWAEKNFFVQVLPYCVSAKKCATFCNAWRDIFIEKSE